MKYLIAAALALFSLPAAAQTPNTFTNMVIAAPAATLPLAGTELLALVQSSATHSLAVSNLLSGGINSVASSDPAAITTTSNFARIQNSTLTAPTLYAGFLGTPVVYSDLLVTTKVPTGSTGFQFNGIGSYLQNNAVFGGTDGAGVGVYSLVVSNINNARSWAFAGGCIDSSSSAVSAGTGRYCIGAELDLTPTSPSTLLQGISLLGSSPSQPAGANGITVGSLSTQSPGLVLWDRAFISQDGAATVALVVGTATVGSSTNDPSQPIVFDYRDGAGAGKTASLNVDASQRLAVTSSAGSGLAKFLVDGGITATLPASGGAGGIYVCVDTAGLMYKKSSCP